ncbi:phage minor head protein [Nocardioides sp. Arc9.136]|uniref:phage minor head protein n=1 Tax=Nocardioides sp. Arc9.136 TaxID=2996826 RepID=UPI002665B931|nr:phage minor head protein [Nocardioides sp. Arc9.136]WKN47139.1 phage minor head protein [Nocardioides sp. Arc9.136]
MAVTARTLRLQRQLNAAVRAITDAQTRDLVRAWVDAWNEIEPDLTAALLEQLTAGDRVTRAQLLRSTRLRKALALVADQLEALTAAAGVRLTGDLRQIVDTAGDAQASVIDSQLPPDSDLLDGLDSWSRVDERQITAIVERSTQQITSLLQPLPAETLDVVRRELIRGVASGSNPRGTAARMVRRAEKAFNGGLGLSRALNIARTETLDAHRAGARLGRMAQADVLRGWQWVSALDTRTCPSCWAQHGSVHPVEEFGPDDHQQGRCTALPLVKPWAELGLDVEEPPSLGPNASDRFESLSSEQQLDVLGPKRYDAWVRGEYPMDSWSQRRSSDGWRDSWGVSPVPQLSGGRAARAA